MPPFNFELKTNVRFGVDKSSKLGDHLVELGFKNTVVIVDKNVYENYYVDDIYTGLDENDLSVHTIIYDEKGEPTYQYLDKVFYENKTAFGNLDCIVGIGGGSVLDTAKGLSVLSTNLGPSIQYRGFPTKLNKPIPVVAIPTTAGTGSEVTYNAVFVDLSSQKKLGINTKLNYPVLAILDPNLILSCPYKVMLSSGLDALVHAVESYGATKSNELSRLFSRRALLHFNYSLNRLSEWDTLDENSKLTLASDLQLGAYYAGIALMNSGSGPSGALSYILGTLFNVPHGLAGGVFLPKIIEFNTSKGFRYTDFQDEEYGFNYLFGSLAFKFNDLRQFGVTEENIEPLLKSVETLQPAFDQNPVPFTVEDAKTIIRSML